MSQIDVTKLDAAQLRNLMDNAQRLGRQDVYNDAFRQLCAILPAGASDGTMMDEVLVQKFWRAVHAAEELRSRETGRTARLSRTRQKVDRDGVIVTMEAMALKQTPSKGFEILTSGGMPELLFEYIILEHPDQFAAAAVEASRARLIKHEIPLPKAQDD